MLAASDGGLTKEGPEWAAKPGGSSCRMGLAGAKSFSTGAM